MMMMLLRGVVCVLLLAFVAGQETDGDVLVLTTENFDAVVGEADLMLVEFYAPWCGHCKKLAPEYAKAATELKEVGIPIAKVDADAEKNKPLAQRYGVRGFPTLKVFRKGQPSDYKGERSAASIVSYMKKQNLPAISPLTTKEEVEKFSTSDKVVVIGFFENRDSTEYSKFKEAADKLRDSFLFGDVVNNADLNKEFGVEAPALILFKQFDEGKNILSADGFEDVLGFIGKYSVPLIDEIGPENYKNYVDSGLPLAYLFVEQAKKDEFIEKVRPIAVKSKGKINWVYIDWAKFAKHAERLGLSGKTVPALAIEKVDVGTHYAFDETTEITSEAVGAWVDKFLSGELAPTIKSEEIPEDNNGPVTVVVAKSYDQIVLDSTKDVLIEFYAPWCGHCKQLAPIYESLGESFKGVDSVVIAKMDATANDVDPKLGVRGFPTIKFFPANKKDTPIDYSGDRTQEAFTQFIKEKASISFELKEVKKDEL